ncbi:MAG: hypothetical protein PVF13_07830 [Chromatiales bacterium]|jgi:hypothetical protein
MPTRTQKGRIFNARPDRIGLRDCICQSKLVSTPSPHPQIESIEQHLPAYAKRLVLDRD